jgi:hypothetical protein
VLAIVGAVLVGVAVVLPWATLERVVAGSTRRFGAGAAGGLLVVFAVVSVAATLGVGVSASRRLRWLAIGSAVACLGTAVVIALSRIAAANHAAMAQTGGSRTAYAVGAAAGVLGALLLLAGSVSAGSVVAGASAGQFPQADGVG